VPQRVVVSAAAPFRGVLTYCAASATEAAAEARIHVGDRTFTAVRACEPDTGRVPCLAVPAAAFYVYVNSTPMVHAVGIALVRPDGETAPSSGLQVVTVSG
jgi:hypothetical protein